MRALERTFRRKVATAEIVSLELARHLTSLSHELNRQVGVLLSREGSVRNVIVGDTNTLQIPEIGRLRGRLGRLRGLRLIHTHLEGESLSEDDLNDLALLRLDLVAMIEVIEGGYPGRIELAHVLPTRSDMNGDDEPYRRVSAPNLGRLDFDFLANIHALESEFSQLVRGSARKTGKERALIVGVTRDEDHFRETFELSRSAAVVVTGAVRQRRMKPHPKTVVGRGKLREIVLESMRRQADVAIFDIDLKPAQARAFEDLTGLKAIDRTQLILDIFAQRAKSRDGKLQVELAQLKYSLPRLTDKDEGLSRLRGGIGGRGPGETVLEVGRRRIYDRIRKLEKQVERIARQRVQRRSRRKRNGIPVISIIGYTNAGKTTLLNSLTDSSVEAKDKLFVTLDPTSRRLRFPREGEVVLTDTVGFLRDLPEDLVSAFKSTLEELGNADVLLHVVDGGDERLEVKLTAVETLIKEMGLASLPRLLVLNKCDLLNREQRETISCRHGGIPISASRKIGLEKLVEGIEEMLPRK